MSNTVTATIEPSSVLSLSPSISNTVTTTLNYFEPPKDGSHPFQSVNVDEKTGERIRNFTQTAREVQITNLRGQEDSVGLDTAGFQFFRHESGHKRFDDDEEIKREYYPESAALIKKLTGANRVVLFDHTIRRHRPGLPDISPDKRQPVNSVHVDQSPSAAERRVRIHVPELATELLKRRYQIINLWRPISHNALDFPLTLCDYRSIDYTKDLVPSTLRYPDRDGETFAVKYNRNHKWNYFRGMTPEEIILIKCFDSIMDGSVAILTPHTAFKDPTTPQDAPLRESIEVRALVFYDDLPTDS